jgi:hypothetical protein
MEPKQLKDMAQRLYMMSECRERVTTSSLATVADTLSQAADELNRLHSIADSDDGAGGDGMRLYLEHRKFRTALERIERDCTARKAVMIARDALGLTQNAEPSRPREAGSEKT